MPLSEIDFSRTHDIHDIIFDDGNPSQKIQRLSDLRLQQQKLLDGEKTLFPEQRAQILGNIAFCNSGQFFLNQRRSNGSS